MELPYRTIQLYTFEGEVVLDPFMGSGQTAIAAIKANRRYVGYKIDQEYAKLADKWAKEFQLEFNSSKLSDFAETQEESRGSAISPASAVTAAVSGDAR